MFYRGSQTPQPWAVGFCPDSPQERPGFDQLELSLLQTWSAQSSALVAHYPDPTRAPSSQGLDNLELGPEVQLTAAESLNHTQSHSLTWAKNAPLPSSLVGCETESHGIIPAFPA